MLISQKNVILKKRQWEKRTLHQRKINGIWRQFSTSKKNPKHKITSNKFCGKYQIRRSSIRRCGMMSNETSYKWLKIYYRKRNGPIHLSWANELTINFSLGSCWLISSFACVLLFVFFFTFWSVWSWYYLVSFDRLCSDWHCTTLYVKYNEWYQKP